jgi:hypothetical protein
MEMSRHLGGESMNINERWNDFRFGVFNYWLVLLSYGYIGNVHLAVNYQAAHYYSTPNITDIVYLQAKRRGINLENKENTWVVKE